MNRVRAYLEANPGRHLVNVSVEGHWEDPDDYYVKVQIDLCQSRAEGDKIVGLLREDLTEIITELQGKPIDPRHFDGGCEWRHGWSAVMLLGVLNMADAEKAADIFDEHAAKLKATHLRRVKPKIG